jgi:hypothetical protein
MSYDYGGYGLGRKADAILGKGKQPSNNSNTSNNTSFLRSPARKEDNSIDSSDDGVGHSENDGIPQHENSTIVEPSEEQCYADIEACYNYLVYNKSVPPSCVILYGKSLGSGPTCWLAQKLCKRFESGRKKSLMNQEGITAAIVPKLHTIHPTPTNHFPWMGTFTTTPLFVPLRKLKAMLTMSTVQVCPLEA